MTESAKAIFLSYASQDAEAARRICDAMRAAGLEVWFDQSELRGGDAWDAAIRKQVRDCTLFVALISANTNARSEGYFRREWNLAVHRMLDMADDQPFLLPVLIDDTPEPTARVPDRFRERQWSRLPGGEVAAGFVERVALLLAGGHALAAAMPVPNQPSAPAAGAARGDDGFWVAVLPFAHGGTDAGIAALADGLSEGIVTGMSRFSYLRVVARSATLRYAGMATDMRSVSRELGARYLMEGSVRQAGNKVRIAVQLVDASTGANLWAETYDRLFDPAVVFDLQDELVPRIVATVADMHGILPRSMSAALRTRDPAQLSPYEAVLRSFAYSERVTADELATARHGVELAVRNAPGYADAWAMLAWLCLQDHAQGFGIQADSLAQGLAAARRAVEAAPSNHLAHAGLAQAFYFRKELESFRNAAERAVALNPMDGYSIAFLGELLTYTGDWKRGLELAGRAKQLNPHHPGWYWYADAYHAHSQGDFRGAIACLLRANLPGHWGFHALLAAAHGQLGEREAAGKALHELLKLRPDFAATVRAELAKWWTPEYVDLFIDGLRKAGLVIAAASDAGAALPGAAAAAAGVPSSPDPAQTARPSLAVMPFVNLSGDPQQDYFADGMMEEIVTALSRVRSIFVIASSSTLCFKGKAASSQAVGRQLGVRYLLEGSVRRSGDRVRIAPKLVDATDGSQIWAERYEGTLDDVFALQDQVALNVVGVIVPTVQNAEIRRASSRPTGNMGSYDLFLRALALVSAYEKSEAFAALELLDRAIALDSRYALAMALAAYTHAQVVVSGWSDDPAHHRRLALDLARRAVQLAEDDSEVLSWVTGAYLPLDENFDDSIVLIDRSIALNPGSSLAWLMSGWLRAAAGDADRAVEHFEMSMRLDPCSSDRGYQLSGIALARFGQRRYAEAAALLKESLQLQPTVSINQALLAACYGHLGEVDSARAAIASYQALSSRDLHERVTLLRRPEHRKAYLDGIDLARPGA